MIVQNTLKADWGVVWDDPGEYPSGAGGGPLPSEYGVEEITGCVRVRLPYDMDCARDWKGIVEEILDDVDLPYEVQSITKWDVEREGMVVTCHPEEWEDNPEYEPPIRGY